MLPFTAGLQEHMLVKVKVARSFPRGEVKDLQGHCYLQGVMPGRSLKGKLLIPWYLVWLSFLLQVTVGGADLQTTGPHRPQCPSQKSPSKPAKPKAPARPPPELDPLPSRLQMMVEDRSLSPPPQSGDGGGGGKGKGKGKGDAKGKGKGKA